MKFAAFIFSIMLAAPGMLVARELRVAAAASLAEAVTEIAESYQTTTGRVVRPMFAGSNVLARQISEGAPIDVFISADQRTMNGLAAEGHVKQPEVLVTNSLVVVLRRDSGLELETPGDLSGLKRIAVGDPDAVPAGVYAKAWLEHLGLWTRLKPNLVGAESVRAALAMVESGHANAGIVYRTDAAVADQITVALAVPPDDVPPIRYPVAICRRASDPRDAAAFITYLRGPAARAVFAKRGFGTPDPE